MDAQRLDAIATLYVHNPAYANLYAETSGLCAERANETTIIEALSNSVRHFGQLQEAPSVLSTLVSSGALVRTYYVDGVPYEGDIRQLQEDESIPDDADIQCFYLETEEGAEIASHYAPDALLAQLFADKPDYRDGFLEVLGACSGSGKSTAELQARLQERNLLVPDAVTGLNKLHASYFTSALENAGALAWVDKKWRTTALGDSVLCGDAVL